MSFITREEVCSSCGNKFLYRKFLEAGEKDKVYPQILCIDCLRLKRNSAEEAKERKKQEIYDKKLQEEHREFLEKLKNYNVLPIENICPDNDNVLYVLGNGFDLMHRVRSSYYNFRDTLGKNNSLRYMLENHLTVEDVWSDLENAIAHFNVEVMTDENIVDMWLDINGAYDVDSGAAEYFMSVEAAATPISTIASELPRRFRMWVETLSLGTTDRPLRSMFRNGKVLNFNYTEFVEKMYGVSKENVCYIHGCRVKEKGRPKEPLILGHYLGASDDAFNIGVSKKSWLRGYKRAYVEMAQNNIIDIISNCDESLTKDTQKIISIHEKFFTGLNSVQTVITIGHSYSQTDLDYFLKIKSSIDNNAKWFFGCYGLRDLINLEQLLSIMNISKSSVSIFRTDVVKTTPNVITEKTTTPKITSKKLCDSKNGKWSVYKFWNDLIIKDSSYDLEKYCLDLQTGIKRAFFICDDKYLLVVIGGAIGVLLFRIDGEKWGFVSELHCDHQHLLVSRLRRVFATESEITFVYNNRIRRYSLLDGSNICNKNIQKAADKEYCGEDITDLFFM